MKSDECSYSEHWKCGYVYRADCPDDEGVCTCWCHIPGNEHLVQRSKVVVP